MPIRLKYDVAAVGGEASGGGGGGGSRRKFGQDLVMQQRKYDLDTKQLQQQQGFQNQQAGQKRAFDLQMAQNDRFFAGKADEERRKLALEDRDAANARQDDLLKRKRDQDLADAAAVQRRQADDQARMARRGDIQDGINNGEFDAATARRLKDLDLAEMDARAGKGLDAGQQADAMRQIEAEREKLLQNRMTPKPLPTVDEEFNARKTSDGKMMKDAKGNFVPVPQEPRQGPIPSWEGFQDDKKFKDYQDRAINELTEGGVKPQGAADPRAVNKRAAELWDIDQESRQAPAAPAQPGVAPGAMAVPPAGQPAVPPAPAPAAAVPNIEPMYSADGESQQKIVPVHDPREQKWIDGGFVQVLDSKLPAGVETLMTFAPPDGEAVHYVDPKDMASAAGQQAPVADSGITDEQFKAAMEEQFNKVGGAQPNQVGAPPPVPFSEQPFENNVPATPEEGFSGNLTPARNPIVTTTPQPNKLQNQGEQLLRNAAPVVADGTAAPTDTASAAPAVSPDVTKFWDTKIGGAKNESDKLEFEAAKNFASQGQPPEVMNAIMVFYGQGSQQERMEALKLLLSKNVDPATFVKPKSKK